MNVASLDLCKELCNLSSWGDDTEFVYYVNDGQYSGAVFHRTQVFAKPGNMPAYDLGYLLRKLQLPRTTVLVGTIGRRSKQYSASYIPDQLGEYDILTMYHKADTPENAAAKLCIELFKQGLLTKQGDQTNG